MNPFASPAARPTARHSATATGRGSCQVTRARASSDELRAMTDPTDRSMPAAISTSVIPTEITVSAGI